MSASADNHLFIITWDDQQGLCTPMTWDSDCLGAVTGFCKGDKIAVFTSRKEAQAAIVISARYAALCKAQGKSVNEDFTTGRRNLQVVELARKGGAR